MKRMRKTGAGPRVGPAFFRQTTMVAAALMVALSPVVASARTAPSYKSAQVQIGSWQQHSVQPLWVYAGQLRPEAQQLIDLVRSARVDGLDPDAYRVRNLEGAVRAALGGNPRDLARADFMLSQTLVAFARDMRTLRSDETHYADRTAFPTLPSTGLLLDSAARAPSLSAWLDKMPWMNPFYAELRDALRGAADPRQAKVLRVNMERARALPGALQGGRYVMVDAAAARLYMIENGEVKGTMRVVVGRIDNQTPMVAGIIRYAILNPYWNVPPDLAATRLAPHVVSGGLGYLKAAHYQVLSDWNDGAKPVDPKTIDWRAVAAGRVPDIRMRQLPGPENSMGRMKFMFPNEMGIYLHDTDDKSLFAEPARQKSGGCIRLQNAKALGKWLFGKSVTTTSTKPEQKVALPRPVPVYVTYLTAAPENGQIAFRDDFYNRDGFGVHGSAEQTAAR